MIGRKLGRALGALAAVVFASALPPAAHALDGAAADAAFYRGKTVTYLVTTSPGGGYDFFGRLIATKMAEHLPGATVVVRNIPGDHQLLGANAIYAAAPDGLTIGAFSTALIYNQLMVSPNVHFDLRRMSWIGNAGSDQRGIVVPPASPIATFRDLHQPGDPFLLAVSRVGSTSYYEAKLLQAALNLNMSIISGYAGNYDQQAMESGDLDAAYGRLSAYSSFVAGGHGRILFHIGGNERHPPSLSRLTRSESADAQAVIELIRAQADIGRPTAGPPGIPAKRLAALRTAYRMAVEDPDAQETAARAGYSLKPYGFGNEVGERITAALNQSPRTIALIDAVFGIGNSAAK